MMRAALALMIAIAIAACTPTPQEKAQRVADAYMETIGMAREGGPKGLVTVTEEGPHWIVTYHVPEGWAGGETMVAVDKRTMRAVDHIGGQ